MILERIQEQAQGLSKSERRVADVILNEPHAAIRLSIAKMAEQAEVSQPTVNRFSRRVGCIGYPDLKLKLAQQLASSDGYKIREISEDLTGESIFARMLESHLALAQDAHQRVGQWPVVKMVDWITAAHRVIILAGDIESAVAERLVTALRNQGIQASLSLPTAREALGNNDVVVALDLTGASHSNTMLEPYRVRGARLIAVAPNDLDLAQNADLVIPLVETAIDHEASYWITQALLILFADSLIIATSARRGRTSINQTAALFQNRA